MRYASGGESARAHGVATLKECNSLYHNAQQFEMKMWQNRDLLALSSLARRSITHPPSYSTTSIVPHEYISALLVGRDSSVGIATRYGLDGPGIGTRWR